MDPNSRRTGAMGPLSRANISLASEAEAFSRLAAGARARMPGASLRTVDHFRGLYLKGFMTLEFLREILEILPPGLTELMVHPGRAPAESATDLFAPFSSSERERELDALKDGRFRSMLKEYGIQLTSFPEACS